MVRDELARLERRKAELEAEGKMDLTADVVIPHLNLAELYAKKIENLRDVLADEATRPEAMEIIRSLIERIEAYFGE